MKPLLLAAPLCLTLLGCGSAVRFQDKPIVWAVNDQRDIAEPAEHPFNRYQIGADFFALRRLNRVLELPDEEHAHNTNALDEVPDSTWFNNRIGVREVSPSRAALGSAHNGTPKLPLTIVRGKGGGANPGFFAKDARGKIYLIKFDTKDNPEMQTGTSVIVNRVFWTAGYNVPNDGVFNLDKAQLHIAEDASLKDELGNKRALIQKDVDEALATSPRLADGRYRVSSSEFLDGKPVGGFPARGVREDDLNDIVPHEHRREVRAVRVIGAWVNHTDMKEDNTIDMYVSEGGRRFLRHYFIDFGEAMGSHQAEKGRLEDGYENWWDWEKQGRAVVSLGLWKRPWEDQQQTPWLSVGAFSARWFNPLDWREAYPYWPFFELDAADAFWGAKIVMRFSREVIEAIVAEGKLSHPEASKHLVKTLVARRDIIGKTYLEALSALDHFTIDSRQLCGLDLGVHHGLATSGVVEALDQDDAVRREYTVDDAGRFCMPVPRHDRYSVYRLRVRRGRELKPVLQIHLKGGSDARVLGLIRKERS